jgi:hypothetical protein
MCKLEFRNIKLNKLKLLAGILVFSQITMAQTVSTFGLELGISFSQFPTNNKITQGGIAFTSKTNPLIGPLFGISKDWTFLKHYNFTSSIQYQMAGTKSYHRDQNLSVGTTGYGESWEKLRIHKICVPLTLGYLFKIGELKSSFYLGVRPNIWLSANVDFKYHDHFSIDSSYGGVPDYYPETVRTNLFSANKNKYDKPPKRIVFQLVFGFSSSIGQHIRINLCYNIGKNYSTSTQFIIGMHSSYSYPVKESIISSDYIINVQYIFNRPESKNINSKNE